MAKFYSNKKGQSSVEIETLVKQAAGEVVDPDMVVREFQPTMAMRRAKARFFYNYRLQPEDWKRDNPVAKLTFGEIRKVAGVPMSPGWCSTSTFLEWFKDDRDFNDRVEALSEMALDALQDVLLNVDPKGINAKVQAAKLIIELADKMPKKVENKVTVLDQLVAELDKGKLVALLEKEGKRLAIGAEVSNVGAIDVVEVSSGD